MALKHLCASVSCLAMLASLGCQPTATPAPTAQQEPAKIQAQQALTGVGKRGQSLEQDKGIAKIISGPASALLRFEQKAVLEIQIPHALQLFEATEGRPPKSHQEFMDKIVKANMLVLPELPEGAVYQFNTEKKQLWVYPADEVPSEGL